MTLLADVFPVIFPSRESGVGLSTACCYDQKPVRVSSAFFFSSRRRHTRWPRDWRSDVCSSDLIVAAIWGDPQTLNPAMNQIGAGGAGGVTEIALLLNVGMADVNFTIANEPRLAEQIPSLENGLWRVFPDGRMETTFRIKPNARWHDGTMVSSDDLAFTVRVGQDPEVALLRDRAYESIESVEAIDARTALVRWKTPYVWADSLFSANTVPLPNHILDGP